MLFTDLSGKDSYAEKAADYYLQHNKVITKKAVRDKYSDKTISFLKAVLETLLEKEVNVDIDGRHLPGGIRIKDSTRWNLPENMAAEFPGTGGAGSPATVCVQYEFDLLSCRVVKLELMPGKYSDQKESAGDIITPGTLYIRDLGYVSLDYMDRISNAGSYFLNRLSPSTDVYIKRDDKYEKLDFKYYRKLLKDSSERIEIIAHLGRIKLPCRMIVESVPAEVCNKRERTKEKFNSKYKHKTSEELKTRMGLNIYVTNLPANIYTKEFLKELYGCRWQIELIFKTWKSVMKIDRIKKGKPERVKCEIYVRMILTVIQMVLCRQLGGMDRISPYKVFKMVINTGDQLRKYIWGKSEIWIKTITREIVTGLQKEFKKHRVKMHAIIAQIRLFDSKFRTE